jgi:hypothetical protein
METLRGIPKFLVVVIFIFHNSLFVNSLPRWISLQLQLMNPGRFRRRLLTRPDVGISWLAPMNCRRNNENILPWLPSASLWYRGGSDSYKKNMEPDYVPDIDDNLESESDVPSSSSRQQSLYTLTSDLIRKLDQGSLSISSFNEESLALRDLVTSRTEEYLFELQAAVEGHNTKLPHPRKLLHYLAPKVPAIRQSPDVNLRIHSSRSDVDPGVAACVISNLARACELYDKEMLHRASYHNHGNDERETHKSVAPEISTDRRFEQLVECVVSGVNIQKQKAEYIHRQMDNSPDVDLEEVLDEENLQVDDGLSLQDSCRAAWGISVLGAHHLDTMGGVKVKDLLLALSLRIRELLLIRLQLLRQDDILNQYREDAPTMTTEERLSEISGELANDVATAMWAFACVKACTGLRSPSLFETCCSILCQDPIELRRRAQEEANYDSGHPRIGSSDVIDRLARSEGSENGEDEHEELKPVAISSDKDILLSWLSPREVNTVLWALALHGSNTSLVDDEITLSDTASSLREAAYDRILEWLESDLKQMVSAISSPPIERSSKSTLEKTSAESVTLGVVDAATLLSLQENSVSSNIAAKAQAVPVENLDMYANTLVRSAGGVQEVKVVDAARLLASTNRQENINVETEVIVSPVSLADNSTIVFAEINEEIESIESKIETPRENPHFSPHDLATIAWSVTELRDPLKKQIVEMVIEIFAELSYDGLFLSGPDLSNLAWAVAKYEGRLHDAERFLIMRRIAEHIAQRLENRDVLLVFHPPEVGRVMWAMASVFSTHSIVPDDARQLGNLIRLASRGLQAASSNLSLFSTEDLVRIAWAFLELKQMNFSDLNPADVKALGQILATTEMSLTRWERGDRATDVPSSATHGDGSVFSSFFGRPRINLPILDLVMGGDEEDDSDGALGPYLERSRRPKLRDLSIDPSTLCKASCNFQRISAMHPYIKGGWTMTRVAIRLLSSKKGRLMRECSIHDIARLCEAAALSDVDGHGRELIIGLFARQVVTLLNDALDDENDPEFSMDVGLATASEVATLVWSLGELGVKILSAEELNSLGNKKMRLVSVHPFLLKIQLEELDLTSVHRLIRGLVMMKVDLQDKKITFQLLGRVGELLTGIQNGEELCDLATSISVLKRALTGASILGKEDNKQWKSSESDHSSAEHMSSSIEHEGVNEVKSMCSKDSLGTAIDGVLDSIATIGKNMSSQLTAAQVRRILEVYSLLPYQADEMVDVLAEEIYTRLSVLEDLAENRTLDTLLVEAKEKASVVKSTLYEQGDKSLLDSIKNGFMSLFGPNNEEQKEEEADERKGVTEKIASMIQSSISTTSQAVDRATTEECALLTTLDKVLKTLREEALFELGQSLELIENYRRIEFTTGNRRSRYDRDRRNDIAKRVLSRLFP